MTGHKTITKPEDQEQPRVNGLDATFCSAVPEGVNYQETKYGFDYGAAKIERKCSDDKKGWVCLGIETPRATISVYVTKTGKVRIHDHKTGREFLPANS